MKLVCLSDTHQMHDEILVPDGDILIHAGDFTHTGKPKEYTKFLEWYSKQPHKHKLLICGNHEKEISEETEKFQIICKHYDVKLIHDQIYEIEGIKFFGQPRTPRFHNWGWMYERGEEAEKVWSQLPYEIDVLVCHGPPFGFGDQTPVSRFMPEIINNAGCEAQLNKLKQIKPKLVICGHIHYSYGIHLTDFGTLVVNAASCTEGYKPLNKPIVINI